MQSICSRHYVLSMLLFTIICYSSVDAQLTANNHALLFDPASLTVAVGYNKSTTIQLTSEQDEPILVSFAYGIDRSPTTDYIKPLEPIIFSPHSSHRQIVVKISGLRPGHLIVVCNTTPSLNNNLTDNDFLRVDIPRSINLERAISIIGWIYFLVGSCSFYPQIVLNFRRQSVVGLNFDFLTLNIMGFFCCSVYNVAFYSWREVQDGYLKSHPYGIIPVLLNDVVFGLHGFIASFSTIFQCLFFERSNQRVSYTTSILLILSILFLFITTIVTSVGRMDLLLLFYFYSYVNLVISCIKYIPQIVMNYRRKSTEGWSIWYVILDSIGSVFSLIQMFLLAINYNDWLSIFGSITKFGLCVLSIIFDLIFIVQHYILYKIPQQQQQTNAYQILDNNAEPTTTVIIT